METVKALLDKVKNQKNITSDYALAKTLKIPSARICDYYKDRRFPDNYACLKIAEALHRDMNEIIAIVQIEAEKDEKKKEIWREYYRRIGGIAASIFLTVTTIVTLDEQVYEEQITINQKNTLNTNYTK